MARRSYLNWLVDGRKDPQAEIGFVFLFFYGLERRAVVDSQTDESAKRDRPRIAAELRRLLDIYGEKSGSFRRYAVELLDWVSLADRPSRLYDQPVPPFPKHFELPLYLRLALGQAAVDEVPVPTRLALAWIRLDPRIGFRTASKRCPEEFEQLFAAHYAAEFGTGMVLPRNRTKLKFIYRPASSGLAGSQDFKLTFDEMPDVTVLAAPATKLQRVVDSATDALAPFSRMIGRDPAARASLEAQLLLPPSLWPEKLRQTLDVLKSRLTDDALVMSFSELTASFGAASAMPREKTRQLARALASSGIGFEPDVLAGARPPRPEESIALFQLAALDSNSAASGAYLAAALTLEVASAVATADGEFDDREIEHLKEAIGSWEHMSTNQSRRLQAHLQLLTRAPMTLARLRKKLEVVDQRLRETLASFMASVAQSDGVISADEVKLLERVYRALGVDPEKVFSTLHAVATDEKPAAAAKARISGAGLKLDPTRIAALREDTAKVSAMLADIFTEEDSEPTVPLEADDDDREEQDGAPGGLLGLDEAHSTLARAMLSRPSWSREELLEVAEDLELMLDGALEQMNEAALDKHGVPLFEGVDPVTINQEILETLDQ